MQPLKRSTNSEGRDLALSLLHKIHVDNEPMRRGIAAVALLVSGCAATGPVCSPGLSSMTEVQLFFGGSIAPEQWRVFLEQEVTPRFPDGFTVLETQGQWRNRNGRISRETGHELMITSARSDANEDGLNAIRDAYKRRFAQESVLLAESPVCAGF